MRATRSSPPGIAFRSLQEIKSSPGDLSGCLKKGLRLNPLVHHHVPYWIRSAIGRIYHMFRYTSLLEASCQWPFQEPKLEVPTIYKAYIRPKFQGTSPPQIWSKKMVHEIPIDVIDPARKTGCIKPGYDWHIFHDDWVRDQTFEELLLLVMPQHDPQQLRCHVSETRTDEAKRNKRFSHLFTKGLPRIPSKFM